MDKFDEILEGCLDKKITEMTPQETYIVYREKENIRESFLRFLKWCKIVEAPIPGQTGGGIVPLILWEHIKEIAKTLLTENLITVLKARQIGLSTIVAAYCLWYAMTHVGAKIFLFSQGQEEAKELLLKCRNIYDNLPPFMKMKLDPDSTESMGFASLTSVIKALPATMSAGIGYTASVIVWDEHAKHEYADANFVHAKPAIDRGAQVISVFTADPYSNDNLATSIYLEAVEGENGFTSLFFPWSVIPNRTEEWYERTKKTIPQRELAKLSPELYMTKNYPRTREEALSTAESVAVFDKSVLNVMTDDVRSPINIIRDGIDNDIINIYKDFHIGNFYIAGTDVSLGVGKDYNVTCIMDVKNGDIVADILSRYLAPEELTLHSMKMLEIYHNPLWWVEYNLWGRTVTSKAQELGYRRLGYRDDKKLKPGLVTDEKTRHDLFGQLIPAINDHQIRIYNKEGLQQFYGMIRNANKDGKIEAISSGHDDYVIAVGICWLKKGDVKTNTTPMKAIETLTWDESVPPVIQKLIDRRQYA